MQKKALPPVWLLVAITFMSPFALNVFNPAMPFVAKDLNADIDIVQLTITAYLFALGFSQLFSGSLADYFGRRPILLWGVAVQILGTLIAAVATEIHLLILARILQGLGGGATTVLVRTMVLDVVDREKGGKFLSYISMTIAATQLAAPTIGGYLNFYFSWRAIFYFSFVFNIPLALLIYYYLRETAEASELKTKKFSIFLKTCGSLLRSPVYLGYALCGAFSTCAYLSFASVMPYIFVNKMGGTSASYGNWFLIVSLGYFLGSSVAAYAATRFSVDRIISVGLLLGLCASLFVVFLTSQNILVAALIFVPMGLLTFSRGLLYPNTQSSAISDARIGRGTASGMLAFIQLMLATVFAQSMPFFLELGVTYVFVVIVITLVLAFFSHQYGLFKRTQG